VSTIFLGNNHPQLTRQEEYDCLVKLLLLGDSGVGKSAIVMRFTEDRFNQDLMSTVGLDFKMKTIQIGERMVNVQIWDTAGQEKFRTITKKYYRGASGYILVFDVANRNSFEHISTWLEEINDHGDSNMLKVLVGNKCDLARSVTTEEAMKLAKKLDLPYFETSAATGTNVNLVFQDLVKRYVESQDQFKGGEEKED